MLTSVRYQGYIPQVGERGQSRKLLADELRDIANPLVDRCVFRSLHKKGEFEMCSACRGDYEDPFGYGFNDDVIEFEGESQTLKNIATDELLMAIRKKGKEIEDGQALLKQFLDNCKQTGSVMEALRRSLP